MEALNGGEDPVILKYRWQVKLMGVKVSQVLDIGCGKLEVLLNLETGEQEQFVLLEGCDDFIKEFCLSVF